MTNIKNNMSVFVTVLLLIIIIIHSLSNQPTWAEPRFPFLAESRPMTMTYKELESYFREHNLNELLQDLTSDLALHRPSDPHRHLLKRLVSITSSSQEAVQAMAVTAPEDVSFLRVVVECKSQSGSSLRLFTKKAAMDTTTDRTIRSWVSAARSVMESAVSEALGEVTLQRRQDATLSNEQPAACAALGRDS